MLVENLVSFVGSLMIAEHVFDVGNTPSVKQMVGVGTSAPVAKTITSPELLELPLLI